MALRSAKVIRLMCRVLKMPKRIFAFLYKIRLLRETKINHNNNGIQDLGETLTVLCCILFIIMYKYFAFRVEYDDNGYRGVTLYTLFKRYTSLVY